MSKKFFQDIVPGKRVAKKAISEKPEFVAPPVKQIVKTLPPEKRTIHSLSELPKIKHQDTTPTYEDRFYQANVYGKKGTSSSRHSLWIVAFFSVVFLFFAFSSLFAKAKITVYPKTKEIVLDDAFSAVKDSNSEGVLPFSLVSLKGEETKVITTGEEKSAEEKATGKVMFYNKYSTSPQKLNKDTRLLGTNNKIYKTETAVTIPGMTKADPSKGITESLPGSVEAVIYADVSGEEYNSQPMDFKIAGFKGSAKYDAFDVKSNGAITGGLKGTYNFISSETQTEVENELKETLRTKLLDKITEEIPEGYILFKDATIFKTDAGTQGLVVKNKETPFVLHGTLYGFLFEEKSLTKKIVKTMVSDYDDSDVYIPNINDIVFSTALPADVDSYVSIKNIDFRLSGPVKVIWKFDETKLRDTLLATPKKDFNHLLTDFHNIAKANLILRPIWRTTLPAKSKDIKIIVNPE